LPRDKDAPETAWIQVRNGNGKTVLPEELLTEEDIQKMIQVCENSRDRAFSLCVFETGGRIAEVLNLRRKHQFDDYGATLILSGKTGDRRNRVIASAPALSQWMNDHPIKEPDAPLWLTVGSKNHGEPLLYDNARHLLRSLAEKAGIKKRVNTHSFRHALASFMANVLTESQMQEFFGWTQGSKMTKIYVHLSGRELDSTLLQMHGIAAEMSVTKLKLTVRTCSRCKQKNGSETRFCKLRFASWN
jgi:integrase